MKDKGLRKILTQSGLIRGEYYQIDGSGIHFLNFQSASREDIAQLEKNQQKIMDGFNALLTYLNLGLREVNNTKIKFEFNHIEVYKKGKKK
jgi:hypothetical protein